MTVLALWRYPVKSMQGERLARAWLGKRGIPGDRAWTLRGPDVKPIIGHNASAKQFPHLMAASARYREEPDGNSMPAVEIVLPDGRALAAGPEAAAALSRWLERPLTLHSSEGAHFDSKPLHLVTTGALATVGADARRFRPNVVIEAQEDPRNWVGARLRLGEAVLSIVKITQRCAMVTHSQPGLEKNIDLLRAVARGGFGVYAVAEEPGWAVSTHSKLLPK